MSDAGSPPVGADLSGGDAPLPATGSGVTLAVRIQATVLACPGVADVAVDAATYEPGHDVAGVHLTDDTAAVRVITAFGSPISEIAERVQAAVADLLGGRRLHLFVDDIVAPGDQPPPTPTELAAAARNRVSAPATPADH